MTNDDNQSGGSGNQSNGLESLELGLQPVDPVSPDQGVTTTHDNAMKTLDQAKEEDYSSMTLDEYMSQFEVGAGVEKADKLEAKLRKFEALLVYLAAKMPGLDTTEIAGKILLTKLPGFQVGEAYGDFVKLDPVLLDHDDLTLARHVLVHEMVWHMKLGIQDEGVAEYGTALITGDGAKDYFDLVHNVGIVVGTIGKGDKAAGLDQVTRSLITEEYDDLFDLFATKYLEADPNRTSEEAEKIFQLAFPRLTVSGDGAFEHDQIATSEANEAPGLEAPFED